MLYTITNSTGNPNLFIYNNSSLMGKYRCKIVSYWTSNGQFGGPAQHWYMLYSPQQLYNPVGNSPLIISLASPAHHQNFSKSGFEIDVNLAGVITFELIQNSTNRATAPSATALFTLVLDLEKIS